MSEELGKIDSRLERIEGKLDNHLERVAKLEEAITSMRGSIKLVFTVIIAAVSAAFAYISGGVIK